MKRNYTDEELIFFEKKVKEIITGLFYRPNDDWIINTVIKEVYEEGIKKYLEVKKKK